MRPPRASHRAVGRVTFATAVALLAACTPDTAPSSSEPGDEPSLTAVDAEATSADVDVDERDADTEPVPVPGWSVTQPATMTTPLCDDGGSCDLGVMLDDVLVTVSCQPILDGVTDAVVATGTDGSFRHARAVAGVSPHLMVALADPDETCQTSADWVAGIPVAGRTLEEELTLSVAACRVLGQPYHEKQDCREGGPASIRTWEPGPFTETYAWFPEVVTTTNEQLREGAGPAERLDPASVIIQFERRDFPQCFEPAEVLEACRIGHESTPDEVGDSIEVRGEVQARYEAGLEASVAVWTLTQPGGGPGWWVTERVSLAPTMVSDTDADRRWDHCCPIVVTEGTAPER